jgi:hypothetical protein
MQYMQFTPITVLDNFFDDPDKVRDWALTLDYAPDTNGKWPGLRSKSVHELDPAFFNTICTRFFCLFFNTAKEKISWSVDMKFQLVDSKYGSGWVHTDYSDAQITGLIYLSPNSNLSSGTSIYQEKKTVLTQRQSFEHLGVKEQFYQSKTSFEEMEKYRQIHNSQYEETVRVSNVYNRLVSFDSHLHHAAQDFFGSEEQRLTLVFFVEELYANNTPISRFRRYVY